MKPKKKKNTFRKCIGRIHLWLGLASGIIVFIVAITGCIFVFHDEIQDLTRDWRKVEAKTTDFIAPSILQKKTTSIFPEADPAMVVYQNRERPAHVPVVVKGAPHNIYFNPYSGELLHIQNLEKDFFLIVQDLHMHLLLPEKIGTQVIGIATLIFILMLISGVILWWPKKRKKLSKNFRIKWQARWRRVNYDWHKVTGVYIALLALLVAITGLSFSYEWMHESFYFIGNVGENHPEDHISPEIAAVETEAENNPIDMALYQTMDILPNSGMYFVWDQGAENPIVSGAYPDALEFDHQSNFFFHPQSGELLLEHYYAEKSPGLKLQEMTYGLHTGQYFGLAGKLVAFFISLFVAGLPLSGFMIWWGRKNKSGKTQAGKKSFLGSSK